MSSEVKRYSVVLHVANDSPFRQTGDSCTRPIRTDVVLATDYAALEAENARLAEDVKKWQALAQNVETLERITESAEARRAQLAAIQGGMGAPDITTGRGYPAYSVEAVQRITAAMEAEVADAKSARDAYGQNALDMQAQRDALAAELAAIKGQEPVGVVHLRKGGGISMLQVELNTPLHPGTKLYTLPAAPEGGEV